MMLGDLTLRMINAGGFRLDGGAMHGVVPRTLWERTAPPDNANRIGLSTNCLLIDRHVGPSEKGPRRILIETGNGDKWSDKQRSMFALEEAGGQPGRPRTIVDALDEISVSPGSIDLVLTTHLHFDHSGGSTRKNAEGKLVPTFPQARHVTQKGELAGALNPSERNRASYLPENIAPVMEAGLLDTVDGDMEVAPGIRVVVTPGHTPHHQSIVITGGGRSAIFFGDIIPMQQHLRLAWVMAYDVEPMVSVETKRRLLGRVRDDHAVVLFGHDSRHGGCLSVDERGESTLTQPLDINQIEAPPATA